VLFNLRDIKNAIIIKSNTRLIIFCVSHYYNGGMFCLNQSTGAIKWNKQILKPVMASPATIKYNQDLSPKFKKRSEGSCSHYKEEQQDDDGAGTANQV
jgi:outer membrane protein assembly factor BamB